MYSALSVFDLDHTLLTVNSSFRFGVHLYQKSLMSKWTFCRCLFYYTRHKWLGLSLHQLHQNIFRLLFKGRTQKSVEEEVGEFLKASLPEFFYAPALHRLEEARRQGQFIVILSSSPDFLVGPIARQLNVQEYKSTVYEVNAEGSFDHVDVFQGIDKADYVRDLQGRLNVSTECITVYSDSYLDLPVLKLAGKAIGVIPDHDLRRICNLNGWEII